VGEPLLLTRQYHKNIGRELSVKLNEGVVKEGKLLAVTESAILIEEKVKEKGKKVQLVETQIEFNNIVETKVLISFK
jgi:ribosome maturation factor RimP